MKDIFGFLNSAKTALHAVKEISDALLLKGYIRLYEDEEWNLTEGGKYYVIRGGTSIIAFVNNGGGFMITAAHSDSPAFKVKGDLLQGEYLKLDTEKYGGMINYTWFDRPLTVAGRISYRDNGGIRTVLTDIGDKRVVIPSLAIHMNRNVNENCKFNPAQDLLPLAALGMPKGALLSLAAKNLGISEESIISHDLYLVSADEATKVGLNDELLLAPRIDDLAAVYTALSAFLKAKDCEATPVLAVFDNEEVGSSTKQGAGSTFLYDVLMRISSGNTDFIRRLSSSFMISADNAHAIHPNHPEMADRANAPTLGGGIVVKYNANQRYTTDSISDAVFREICKEADVKVQSYYNRADLPGGSTLGSISNTVVSVPTIDIGIPQLAMHSANETCAIADIEAMEKALTLFFTKKVLFRGEYIEF